MYYGGVTSAVWQRRTHKIFALAIIIIGLTMIVAHVQDLKSIATGSVFVVIAVCWLIWLILKEKKEIPQESHEVSRGSGNPRPPILFLIGGYNLRLSFHGPSIADPNDKPPTYDQILKLNSSSGLPEDYISPHCEKPPRYEDLKLDMGWSACALPPEHYTSSDLAYVHSYRTPEAMSNTASTRFKDSFEASEHHASTSHLLQDELPPPSYEFTMNLHSIHKDKSSDKYSLSAVNEEYIYTETQMSDESLNPFSIVPLSRPNRQLPMSAEPKEHNRVPQSEVVSPKDAKMLQWDVKLSEEEEILQDEFISLAYRQSRLDAIPEPFNENSSNIIEFPHQRSLIAGSPIQSSSNLRAPIEFSPSLESPNQESQNLNLPTQKSTTLDTAIPSSTNPSSTIPSSPEFHNKISQISENHSIPRPPSTRPKILLPKKDNSIRLIQPPSVLTTTETSSVSPFTLNHCAQSLFRKENETNQPQTSGILCSTLQLEPESSIVNSNLQFISTQNQCSDVEPTQVNHSLICYSESSDVMNLQTTKR